MNIVKVQFEKSNKKGDKMELESIFLNSLNNSDNFNNWLIKVRRELHTYPELDFQLPKTTEIICKLLD